MKKTKGFFQVRVYALIGSRQLFPQRRNFRKLGQPKKGNIIMKNQEKTPGRGRWLILICSIACILSLTLLPICALNVLSQVIPERNSSAPTQIARKQSTEEIASELNSLYQDLLENTERIASLNEELEKAREDYAAALKTKELLDQRVSATMGQINDLNRIIESYDRMIAEKQTQIDEHIADYNLKYSVFLERLRQSYEEGVPSPLEIFFYSDSFIDMLTSIERMNDVLEYDQQLMQELEQETLVLIAERADLLSIQNEKQEAEADLQAIKKDLDTRVRECGEYIQQLETENLPALEKYLSDAQIAEDEINRQIEEASEKMNDLLGGNLSSEYLQSKMEKLDVLSRSILEKMESGELQKGSEYFADGYDYIVPVSLVALKSGYISSLYGYRTYTSGGVEISGFHQGVDFAVAFDSPIYAARSGVVLTVEYSSGYGNMIVVLHDDGTQTRYAHCNSISAKPGEYVLQGEEIARVGVTGNATGSCCHLEVRVRENNAWQAVDPFKGYVTKP